MKALIDADILLYQMSAANEREVHWGNDLWTLHSDAAEVKDGLKERLKLIKERLEVQEAILCFSSSENFRKDVFKDYKGNRRGQRKPLAYSELKNWCLDSFECKVMPRLEADDTMGILATQSPGKYIIWSADKDLKQIPGLLWRDDKLETITDHQALEYFFSQTLTGDPTDGYPGCPGVGAVTAQKALGSIRFVDRDGYIKEAWKTVVGFYAAKGLTEDDALVMARCAKILTVDDYDFEKGEVKLWSLT